MDQFLQRCKYHTVSSYEDSQAMERILQEALPLQSSQHASMTPSPPSLPTADKTATSRQLLLVYLAIPPHVFASAAQAIRTALAPQNSCGRLDDDNNNNTTTVRLLVEKPFGRDTDTCRALIRSLQQQGWHERDLFRIDHYLGKVVVQKILAIRRQWSLLASSIKAYHPLRLHAVHIVWKETAGCGGRGGYFDTVGILRDVVQNHLLQILALLGMETRSTHLLS